MNLFSVSQWCVLHCCAASEQCQQIEEREGEAVAFFPHVVFQPGAIYILHVRIDPHRGPDNLEGSVLEILLNYSGAL
eukprot:6447760-Amphidinium_carterae.1